ncbi:MAG: hypothetical protein HRU18_18155 [Pseudoalteromonas sp.]|uniref:hypothetical protein n=1 Tax=Pseudoalteromonas sp. TaxID=53249 RepID=UPI001D25300B|nr:hypothetical protein [Pseudoalteromonas sp.]NRA80127.1 hypothetical protein [Pseudoalteromonas sp.]
MFKIILGLLLLIPTHVTLNTSTDNQRAPAYENWNWLSIQPENRCSPFNRKVDYVYEKDIENAIVTKEPYTGRYFSSSKPTDIEHIVATSEAHDSGLCSRTKEVRQAFASDLTITSIEKNIQR